MEKEKSCGCIVIDNGKVLLIQHLKGHWDIPKGHMEAGETEQETALREVKEETGVDVEIISDKRYTLEYTVENGNLKEVVYFIAKKIGGDEKAQETEVSEIRWLAFDEAVEMLTYDNSKELLRKAINFIEKN